MAEDTALSGSEFVREYFAGTHGNIFLGCLRNADSNQPHGQITKLITQANDNVDRFIDRCDKPICEGGIYFCTATLRNGHTDRKAEDCFEFVSLFADTDDKNHDLSWGQVIALLDALPCPPTLIVNSGHGLQPHWLFATPSEDGARVEALRRKLQSILASDSVADPPRLMRLPGSHNSKNGDWLPVEVVRYSGKRYALDELESWLSATEILIPLKVQPKTNGHDRLADALDEKGSGEPVDVGERLTTMRYKGVGLSSIHISQLQCTASLLRSGVGLEETVETVLDATQRAVASDPQTADWNWGKEQRDIRKMALAFISKNPELACLLPDELFAVRQEQLSRAAPAEPDIQDPTWPTPYVSRDVAQIPRRNFALGQHYIVGACSITASPGGIGKSTLSLLDAVSFKVGRNLLTGEILDKPRRAWIWNAEDDRDEMERRLVGICEHYGINRKSLDGWLFLDSGYELPLDLAQGNGRTVTVQGPLIDRIAARVKERNIEVVMLDPLVAVHSMPENDNPGHAKLIRALSTRLANPSACSVDINAHTRKPSGGQDSMTADDVRGAGSIIYSARSGRILHPMSLAEAEKYDISAEDRLSYYRLERAKANMAKRGTICWVRMTEVPIANGIDGGLGDSVAVPTVWMPPDAMEGITETVANAIAGEIAKGEFKRDVRAGAAWAGRVVGLRCGIDVSTKPGRDRARIILETLIKKGALAVEIRADQSRHSREYVVSGVLHG